MDNDIAIIGISAALIFVAAMVVHIPIGCETGRFLPPTAERVPETEIAGPSADKPRDTDSASAKSEPQPPEQPKPAHEPLPGRDEPAEGRGIEQKPRVHRATEMLCRARQALLPRSRVRDHELGWRISRSQDLDCPARVATVHQTSHSS